MKFDFTPKARRAPQAQASDLASTTTAMLAPSTQGRVIAVIGTAGRDKSMPLTCELWDAMCDDLRVHIKPGDHLVSGGAAWADHLAVHARIQGWVERLTLFLPAPLNLQGFVGPNQSAASAANFYHQMFSRTIGYNTISELADVESMPGVEVFHEEPAPGYGAMFARNKKVAQMVNAVRAYTFGESDDTPADGGTLNTWKQIQSDDKTHVSLLRLAESLKMDVAPQPPRAPTLRFKF